MLFNSFVFIFAFLPITWLFYFGLNRMGLNRLAKWILVVASLYFYAYFNVEYLPIILVSVLINYGIGLLLCSNRLSSSELPPPVIS
jgi:D-alanyl-lipoteichoic acid acyltransferase DltB (MBOAT superfamily)